MIHCPAVETFEISDYIVSTSGNKISRKAIILKPQNLEIPSGRVIIKHDVVIDAENAGVAINKYVLICEGTKLQPCMTLAKQISQVSMYL